MKHPRKHRNTMHRNWLSGALAVGLALGAAGVLYAQPDPNNPPVGENPPPPPQNGRVEPGDRPDVRNMTPEELKQWEQQRQQRTLMIREQGVRTVLNQYGFGDKTLQDAVIAHVAAQDLALAPISEDSRKLREAMVGDTGDAQITALLTTWRADIAAEKKRREAALAELDAKIHFTKNPRLEALLTMRGFIGEENTFSMVGARGQGGMNGRPGNFGVPGNPGDPGGPPPPPPEGPPPGGPPPPPPMDAPPPN